MLCLPQTFHHLQVFRITEIETSRLFTIDAAIYQATGTLSVQKKINKPVWSIPNYIYTSGTKFLPLQLKHNLQGFELTHWKLNP